MNLNINFFKFPFLLLLSLIINSAFAQKHYIVNASISLRQGKLNEAKRYIDEAFLNESTSNDPKMWNYRAPIYLEIALKKPELDNSATLKATDSFIKCLKKGKKNKIIVEKWTTKEDVLAGLIQCGYKLFNVAIDKYNLKEYKRSIEFYEKIFDIIPFDEEDQLKRVKITEETILYNSFLASSKLKNNELSKKLLQKLINLNFNEPSIYISMSNIYKSEDKMEKAIEYLSLGRDIFEDDQSMITSEINLFIELGKTLELIEKLDEAIELDSENSLLYFNRGTIYDQEGEIKEAEEDYNTAIKLDPSSFGSNYNLGALYFNKAVELNNSANATRNDVKYKKLKKEADIFFEKCLPFLVSAYSINPNDKNTLLSLKQLYYLKGDYKKSEEFKFALQNLKDEPKFVSNEITKKDLILNDNQKSEKINSKPKLPPNLIVSNLILKDPNNNNTIEAGEKIYLEFDLNNSGKGKAYDIKIKIDDISNTSGLSITKNIIPIKFLNAGDSKRIIIPVTSNLNLTNGGANFEIKISEENGFNVDPFFYEIFTKSFVKPYLEIVDFIFSSDNGEIKVGKTAVVKFSLQNTGQGIASSVKIDIKLPKNVFASESSVYMVGTLDPGEVVTYNFEFFTNKLYEEPKISIEAIVTEKFNKYGCISSMSEIIGKSINNTIVLNPKSSLKQNIVDIKRFSLTSDVDKNIPSNSKVNNRFALIIGNEDYISHQMGLKSEQNVDFAKNDARVFKEYALKTLGVKEDNLIFKTDATSGILSQELNRIIKLTELEGENAELIIYYAGHGFPHELTKVPYLIPVDVSGGDLSRAINLQELYIKLGNLKARKVTVFLDACFTGGGRESGLMASRGVKVKPKEGSLKGNLVVFSSSSGDQSSLPYVDESHGIFTYHLLKKLQESEGKISYGDLYDDIKDEVNKTALRNQGMDQRPKVNTSQKVANSWKNWKF